MKEEFITYLWQNRLLEPVGLLTTDSREVSIVEPGSLNHDSGPDFTAARIRIGNTLWAGNAEIHIRSSDWYKHKHHLDPAYDNTILHIVYEYDGEARNSKGEVIPALQVKNRFRENILRNYLYLKSAKTWVPCQQTIHHADGFVTRNWLARLLVERLERKTSEILHYLRYFEQNWEYTFYFLLARNFGFKVNSIPFGMLIQKTPFQVLLKNRDRLEVLEALLFGQAGLLADTFQDDYPKMLQTEYGYQRKLHHINPINRSIWKFSRMRPTNFPTIRIAQYAMLLHKSEKLFDLAVGSKERLSFRRIMGVRASSYWDGHYRFDKASAHSPKVLGEEAVNNLMINTIIPVMFLYGKENMKPGLSEKAIDLMQTIPAERNQVISKWTGLGIKPCNAAESQALIELKKHYCTPRKCLSCHIGFQIIRC